VRPEAVPGDTPHPGPLKDHSGNIRETFKEYSGNMQATFRQHSANLQGTFMEHSAFPTSGAPIDLHNVGMAEDTLYAYVIHINAVNIFLLFLSFLFHYVFGWTDGGGDGGERGNVFFFQIFFLLFPICLVAILQLNPFTFTVVS
jgi:hypothetical protein